MDYKPEKINYRMADSMSDMAVEAWGKSPEQLLANLGVGMFAAMVDIDKIRLEVKTEIKLEEDFKGTYEDAVISWLQELIYRFETDKILFSEFEVINIDLSPKITIHGFGMGEKVDKLRHDLKVGIKAATYHQLKVSKNNNWHCKVIFDI